AEGKDVLGRCLLQGIGTDKNKVAAERLIRAAADGGFPLSSYTLAMLSLPEDRRAIPEDFAADRPLLEKAAAASVAPAKIPLAITLLPPARADEPEVKAAVRLLKEADEAGDASATFFLFRVFSQGAPGVPRDLDLARATLERGAGEGDPHCQLALACEYYPRP